VNFRAEGKNVKNKRTLLQAMYILRKTRDFFLGSGNKKKETKKDGEKERQQIRERQNESERATFWRETEDHKDDVVRRFLTRKRWLYLMQPPTDTSS